MASSSRDDSQVIISSDDEELVVSDESRVGATMIQAAILEQENTPPQNLAPSPGPTKRKRDDEDVDPTPRLVSKLPRVPSPTTKEPVRTGAARIAGLAGPKKSSLRDVLRRLDDSVSEADSEAPADISGAPIASMTLPAAPKKVAEKQARSSPSGPLPNLFRKFAQSKDAPKHVSPSKSALAGAKVKISEAVEQSDPIEIDSDDADFMQMLTTSAPQKSAAPPAPSSKVNPAPVEAGEPLLLSEPGAPVVEVPAAVNRRLRDYQRDGVRFLYSKFKMGMGAILGDDMGLGKARFSQMPLPWRPLFAHLRLAHLGLRQTIQTIAFLSAILPIAPTNRALIVAPASVLFQWQDECKKWGLKGALLYHGQGREIGLTRLRHGSINVLITNYETMTRDLEAINSLTWSCVIFDEVHKMKGRKNKGHVAAKALKTTCKYGLTGTLIQNHLEELWALMDLITSGTFVSLKRMRDQYINPIKNGQKQNASKRELANRRIAMQSLATELKKYVVRRDKTLLAGVLPSKVDEIVYTPLTQLQCDIYRAVLGLPEVEMLKRNNEPCDCGSTETRGRCCFKFLDDGRPVSDLSLWIIGILSKLCSSVLQLLPLETDSEEAQTKTRTFCQRVMPGELYKQVREMARKHDFATTSGKLIALRTLLSMWRSAGDKVLVFSHSTRMLDHIEELVRREHGSSSFCRLDGSTPLARRHELVTEFTTSQRRWIFLASTNAGGLGLNLTSANRVVVFDPQWNPSADLQAQDRAYRIGQLRDVKVYRFVSAGTLEERIYQRQIYKTQLHNSSVQGKHEKRWFLGAQGVRGEEGDLFGLGNLLAFDETNVLTNDIIDRAEAVYRQLKFDALIDTSAPGQEEPGTEADGATIKEMLEGKFDDVAALKREVEEEEARFAALRAASYPGDATLAALASIGVKYTHKNTDMFGDSAIEKVISAKAEKQAQHEEQREVYRREQQRLAALQRDLYAAQQQHLQRAESGMGTPVAYLPYGGASFAHRDFASSAPPAAVPGFQPASRSFMPAAFSPRPLVLPAPGGHWEHLPPPGSAAPTRPTRDWHFVTGDRNHTH